MKQKTTPCSSPQSSLHADLDLKTCTCPQCGRRLKHEPGVPCVDRTCPLCGVPLKSR